MSTIHTRLSVNVNKFATLRNARGKNMPDVLRVALDCEEFGAEGITVHPRPDERHIKYADVRNLKPLLRTELNMEGNPIPSFSELVMEVIPAQVTMVPDSENAITSNAGWDLSVPANRTFLREKCTLFHSAGIRCSIFIAPDSEMVKYAAETGCDRVELFTEKYAEGYAENREKAVAPYVAAAEEAAGCGIGLNAGHDLNLDNLRYFARTVPDLLEVSIGHALICDALYLGLEKTIARYMDCL